MEWLQSLSWSAHSETPNEKKRSPKSFISKFKSSATHSSSANTRPPDQESNPEPTLHSISVHGTCAAQVLTAFVSLGLVKKSEGRCRFADGWKAKKRWQWGNGRKENNADPT